MKTILILFLSLIALNAQEFYYTTELEHPDKGVALEIGGLCLDKSGGLMMTTRRGEVWHRTKEGKWTLFASGLQEPLGIIMGSSANEYYVLQRPEITRLVDENNDGVADLYDSFSKGWGFEGNYHSYAMAFSRDKEGNFYGGLGLPFSRKEGNKFSGMWLGTLDTPERGIFFKVDKEGNYSQFASGVREPVGSALNEDGDIFVTDTQGSFISTNYVIHVAKGDFLGHPEALIWDKTRPGLADKLLAMPIKERNQEIDKIRKRPVLYIPYRKLGASVGGLTFDNTKGKFGPFSGQLIIAEVIDNLLMRGYVEKVDGVYQGAVFALSKNVGTGGLRPVFSEEGNLYLGKTARGWGHGSGLTEIKWNGKVPFDIKEINVQKDGFKLTFTKAVKELKPEQILFDSFKYEFTEVYNAPMYDKKVLAIKSIELAADGLSAIVKMDGLAEDTVVHIEYKGLTSATGETPIFFNTWYTLIKLPK